MQTDKQVPALTRFKHRDEDGNIVSSEQAWPATKALETKYYFLQERNHNMIRPDGMKLGFIHQIHATELLHTQRFLDAEIAEGHPYLKAATKDQILAYKMHLDPTEAVREHITPQIESQLRVKLEAELLQQLAVAGISIPADFKLTPASLPVSQNEDAERIAGTSQSSALAALVARQVTSGAAQVTVTDSTAARTFQASTVGSNKIASGAIDSNSAAVKG